TIAFDLYNAVDADVLSQPIVEISSALNMSRLHVVLARFHIPFGRRLDANVDVLRETVDDAEAFGKGGPSLELKYEAESLQAVEAVHDPIIFFDERRVNALVLRHNPNE